MSLNLSDCRIKSIASVSVTSKNWRKEEEKRDGRTRSSPLLSVSIEQRGVQKREKKKKKRGKKKTKNKKQKP